MTTIRQAQGIRRQTALLLVLCGAIFLDSLDISMTGVALPAIRGSLGMTTPALQWVVSAYVLGYGGFLLFGGRVADLFGRRRVFVISLAVFLAASGLGAVAMTGDLLIASRFVKGVAAAFTAPAALSILTTRFDEGPARNRALSFFTATGAAGFSLGLVFSGLLTEAGWRWVFVFPIPVAAAVLGFALAKVPHDEHQLAPRPRLDLGGAATLTAGMLALVFAIVSASNSGWGSLVAIFAFASAPVLLAAFVVIELRVSEPLVRFTIFRSRSVVAANLGALGLFGGWATFMFVTPLYMHAVGWSPIVTGLYIFPAGLVVIGFAPRVAGLVGRFGTTALICVGLASHVAAYLLFLRIGPNPAYLAVVLPTVLLGGLGFALAYGPLNIAATAGVEASQQGLAAGLVTSALQFGGAIALAIATAVGRGDENSAVLTTALPGYRATLIVAAGSAAFGLLTTLALHRRARDKRR